MMWHRDKVMLSLLCAFVEGIHDGHRGNNHWPDPGVLSAQECLILVAICSHLWTRTTSPERRAELEGKAREYWDAWSTAKDHGAYEVDVFPFADVMLAAPGEPRACTTCGCTDERACLGGCSWVAPGLCSRCAEAEHVETPEGTRWRHTMPAGGGALRVLTGFTPKGGTKA